MTDLQGIQKGMLLTKVSLTARDGLPRFLASGNRSFFSSFNDFYSFACTA